MLSAASAPNAPPDAVTISRWAGPSSGEIRGGRGAAATAPRPCCDRPASFGTAMAVLSGKLRAKRPDCALVAGKPMSAGVRRWGCRGSAAAGADRSRSRCGRRSVARRAEGAFPPRPLRPPLAAVCLPRPSSSGLEAAAGAVGEVGRFVSRLRGHRLGAEVVPRASGGVVWGRRGGTPIRPGGECRDGRGDRDGADPSPCAQRGRRQGATPLPGFSPVHAGRLELSPRVVPTPNGPAARPIRASPAPRRRPIGSGRAPSAGSSAADAAGWGTASGNVDPTCSPAARRAIPCAPDQPHPWFAGTAHGLLRALRRTSGTP